MRSKWFWAALLAACIVVVYWNSFPGAFHYDDYALMLSNPRVSDSFPYSDFLQNYGGRPLTLWTLHMTYRLFGDRPLAYHATSVALHVAACLLLFLCLSGGPLGAAVATVRRLGGSNPPGEDRNGADASPGVSSRLDHPDLALRTSNSALAPTAFAGTLLFALHPFQTQAVNYIWSRSMLLMAVLTLAALLTIRINRPLGLILWQLAIWSRMDAIVALPLLLWRNRSAATPLGVIGLANVVAFGWGAYRLAPAEVAWTHSDVSGFFLAQPVALLEYLRLAVWPSDLHLDRDFGPIPLWASLLAGAIIAAIGAQLWRKRGVYPGLLLGAAWWVLWLSPSLLVPNADCVNESRAYLALAGFSIAAATLPRPLASWKRRALGGGWAAAAVALAAITLLRNPLWSDDVALCRDAAGKSPKKGRVQYNLGSALARRDLTSEAETAFRKAVQLEPENDLGYSALGYCAEVQARPREAVVYYRQALRLNPRNARAIEGLRRLKAWNEDQP